MSILQSEITPLNTSYLLEAMTQQALLVMVSLCIMEWHFHLGIKIMMWMAEGIVLLTIKQAGGSNTATMLILLAFMEMTPPMLATLGNPGKVT